MKLCRFELLQTPGQIHSGIFYDNRVYETDGKNPIAVYELGNIHLLSPIGHPSSIRVFEQSGSKENPNYYYLNPTSHLGTQSEWTAPSFVRELDFEVRVAIAIGKGGDHLEIDHAAEHILGYTIFVNFLGHDLLIKTEPLGIFSVCPRDFSSIIGPLLITPEEFQNAENTDGKWPENWKMTFCINEKQIFEGNQEPEPSFVEMIKIASVGCPLQPGDIFCSSSFNKPSLKETELRRFLLPGDRVRVTIEGLGALIFKVS